MRKFRSLNVARADSLTTNATDPIPLESAFLVDVGLGFFARYSRIGQLVYNMISSYITINFYLSVVNLVLLWLKLYTEV